MGEAPRLIPPFGGVATNVPFADQAKPGNRGRFVPLAGERNMRPFPSVTGQNQYGTRPGFARRFAQRFGTDASRRFQMLEVISRASAVTSYTLGDPVAMTATTATAKRSQTVVMNAGLVQTAAKALRDAFKVYGAAGVGTVNRNGAAAAQAIDAAASGVPNSLTPTWCGRHPNSSLACVAFNHTASSQKRTLLVFIEPVRGAFVCAKSIAPFGEDPSSAANMATAAFCWTAEALWVARGTALWYVPTPVLAGRAVVWQPTGYAALLAAADVDRPLTAASRIVGLSAYTAGTRTFLWAAFEGSTDPGAYANPAGAVTTGTYAKHYRAGVFLLEQLPDVGELTYKPVTQDLPDAVGLSTDQYVELTAGQPTAHNSLRFSAWLDRFPRGCLPVGVAADQTDGSCYVIFSNQGYGPDNTFTPSGSVRYSSVAKVTSTGLLLWEVDPGTVIGTELGGKLAGIANQYPTDLPDEDGGNAGTTNSDGPALRSVATDSAGLVVVAGRVNNGRYSVFGLDAFTGALRWRQRTQSNNLDAASPAWVVAGAAGKGTPRNSVSIDPSDGQVIVAAARSDTYTETNGAHPNAWADVFKLGAVDGTIQWGMSATQDTVQPAPVCITAGDGYLLYGCPDFTDV